MPPIVPRGPIVWVSAIFTGMSTMRASCGLGVMHRFNVGGLQCRMNNGGRLVDPLSGDEWIRCRDPLVKFGLPKRRCFCQGVARRRIWLLLFYGLDLVDPHHVCLGTVFALAVSPSLFQSSPSRLRRRGGSRVEIAIRPQIRFSRRCGPRIVFGVEVCLRARVRMVSGLTLQAKSFWGLDKSCRGWHRDNRHGPGSHRIGTTA